jgi:hypothetical protein
LPGKPLDLAVGSRRQVGDVEPRLLEQRHHDAVLLVQQGAKQMRVVHHGVAPGARELSRLLERLGGLHRQSIGADHESPVGNFCALFKMPFRQRVCHGCTENVPERTP